MASVPQTADLVILSTAYASRIVRAINQRSVLLRLLRIVQGKGPNCAWAVKSAGTESGENYADGADATNFGEDLQWGPVLPWGLYRKNFIVSGLAQAVSMDADTPEENRAAWANNIVDATKDLTSTINVALNVGPGTGTTVAGLGVAIGQAGNIYGGLNRATPYAWWQPYVVDPGVDTALTLYQIRTDLATIYDNSGFVPEFATCPSAVFLQIAALFDSQRNYAQDVTTARGVVKLDASAKGIEIDGCVFFKDKDAAAQQINYINSQFVEVRYLKPVSPPGVPQMTVSADDGEGNLALAFGFDMLAKTGDADKASVKAYLQMVCSNPLACGVRKHIAV